MSQARALLLPERSYHRHLKKGRLCLLPNRAETKQGHAASSERIIIAGSPRCAGGELDDLMQEHVINIIGSMLTLAAPGSTPQKPHFAMQVVVNSILALPGQDDLEARQRYLWGEVRAGVLKLSWGSGCFSHTCHLCLGCYQCRNCHCFCSSA